MNAMAPDMLRQDLKGAQRVIVQKLADVKGNGLLHSPCFQFLIVPSKASGSSVASGVS